MCLCCVAVFYVSLSFKLLCEVRLHYVAFFLLLIFVCIIAFPTTRRSVGLTTNFRIVCSYVLAVSKAAESQLVFLPRFKSLHQIPLEKK